jgi:hypothetical protein
MGYRPIFTGDIFTGVPVLGPHGDQKTRAVMILEHPCTMRTDGVTLSQSILVAKVEPHAVVLRPNWSSYGKLMPLPDVIPTSTSLKRNQAAFFDNTYHVHPDDLDLSRRIACLSEVGTYLLWQRWVRHSSRVIAPLFNFEEMNSHVFAETDLIQDWCEFAEEHGVPVVDAFADAAAWLDGQAGSRTRRDLLKTSLERSALIRDAKKEVRSRYGPSAIVITLPSIGAAAP